MNLDPQTKKQDAINVTLSYVFATVTGFIGLMNWILLRESVLVLMSYYSVSTWSAPAIDNFSFLMFGIIWLIVVFFSQNFYLNGLRTKKLWRNFSLITAIQILLLVLCQLLPFIVGYRVFDVANLILIGVEILIGIVMTIYAVVATSKRKGRTLNSSLNS